MSRHPLLISGITFFDVAFRFPSDLGRIIAGLGRKPLRRTSKRVWLALLALFVMGRSAPAAGDQDEAKRYFREGNGLYDHGHFAEAVADFDRCLEQDPQFLEAYYNRALAEELLDRSKAINDWKRFVEAAAGREGLKWDRARAQARIQILETLPAPPAGLAASRYVESAGDYYPRIATSSEGSVWRAFPLKVFLGSAPDLRWVAGAREALDIWSQIVPLRLAAEASEADIRMDWQESLRRAGQPIDENDWLETIHRGDPLAGQRVIIITVDLSQRWSKDDMRAMILHELGHALGIRGHSNDRKDIMYLEAREGPGSTPGIPRAGFWKTLPKQPSQRDVNTLVRLYNSAGLIARFD